MMTFLKNNDGGFSLGEAGIPNAQQLALDLSPIRKGLESPFLFMPYQPRLELRQELAREVNRTALGTHIAGNGIGLVVLHD